MIRVIAEYGQTMGGSISEAHDQVDVAAAAGCWGYKTQLLRPETIASPGTPLYWANTLGHTDQRRAFLAAGIIPYEDWGEIADHCARVGLRFVATPFDLEAVGHCARLGGVIKVASGDITYLALLRAVAATGADVILSTGASTLPEVMRAADVLKTGANSLTVLACSLVYPTPPPRARVDRVRTLREWFPELAVGYSDHTSSPIVAACAAILGAQVLEVHTTLRPEDDDVADHAMALDPVGLAEYVAAARLAEGLRNHRGVPGMAVASAEEPARLGARRSLCAANPLREGDVIGEGDLTALRPGDGVSPWDEGLYLGQRVLAPIGPGEQLNPGYNVTKP